MKLVIFWLLTIASALNLVVSVISQMRDEKIESLLYLIISILFVVLMQNHVVLNKKQ